MYVIKPNVINVTESEIRKALNSKDEDNLIVAEFSQLLKDMIGEYRRLLAEQKNTRVLLGKTPSCAMEKIALEILSEMAANGLILDGQPHADNGEKK